MSNYSDVDEELVKIHSVCTSKAIPFHPVLFVVAKRLNKLDNSYESVDEIVVAFREIRFHFKNFLNALHSAFILFNVLNTSYPPQCVNFWIWCSTKLKATPKLHQKWDQLFRFSRNKLLLLVYTLHFSSCIQLFFCWLKVDRWYFNVKFQLFVSWFTQPNKTTYSQVKKLCARQCENCVRYFVYLIEMDEKYLKHTSKYLCLHCNPIRVRNVMVCSVPAVMITCYDIGKGAMHGKLFSPATILFCTRILKWWCHLQDRLKY